MRRAGTLIAGRNVINGAVEELVEKLGD